MTKIGILVASSNNNQKLGLKLKELALSQNCEVDLINLVEETMKQEPREENEIQITKAEIVASFEEETKQIILANIYQMSFIPEEGSFLSSSGAMFPVEIQYEIDDKKLVNPLVIYPLDGSEFSSSLKKMSRNNIKWYNQLMESQNAYHRIYNDMIQKLKKEIVENNLDGPRLFIKD